MHAKLIGCSLAGMVAACAFGSGTVFDKAEPASEPVPGVASEASYVTYQIGGWTFSPAVSAKRQVVEGWVGSYRGSEANPASITTVWFEREADGWRGFAFYDNDPTVATAHAVLELDDPSLFSENPDLNVATMGRVFAGDLEPAVPMSFGVRADSPWRPMLEVFPNEFELLNVLADLGEPTAPELAEIAARVMFGDAVVRTAGDELDNESTTDTDERVGGTVVGTNPVQPVDPVERCPIVVAGESPDVSTESDREGLSTLFERLTVNAESHLFGRLDDLEDAAGILCRGCTTTYGPCVLAGPGIATRSQPSTGGQLHCYYRQAGTKMKTVTGKTFWCCDPCTGTGPVPCQGPEYWGTTVIAPALCPATWP